MTNQAKFNKSIKLYGYLRAWVKELDNKDSKKKPSFARALIGIFGASYVLPGFQTFIDECFVK